MEQNQGLEQWRRWKHATILTECFAHRPAYVATVIGAEPLDLARKIDRLRNLRGPRMILALSPCPTGWDFDPRETVNIGRLAVKTGVWPLKEYIDGKVVHTRIPRERLPVEEYLKTQGRFRHLFEPVRNTALLEQLQARVDAYWEGVQEPASRTDST